MEEARGHLCFLPFHLKSFLPRPSGAPHGEELSGEGGVSLGTCPRCSVAGPPDGRPISVLGSVTVPYLPDRPASLTALCPTAFLCFITSASSAWRMPPWTWFSSRF